MACHTLSLYFQVRVIPVQLQRLLTNLLLLDQQSASVDALTSSFGWSNNEVGVCNSDLCCGMLTG